MPTEAVAQLTAELELDPHLNGPAISLETLRSWRTDHQVFAARPIADLLEAFQTDLERHVSVANQAFEAQVQWAEQVFKPGSSIKATLTVPKGVGTEALLSYFNQWLERARLGDLIAQRVVEPHADGSPHLEVLMTFSMPKRFLQGCRAAGMDPLARVCEHLKRHWHDILDTPQNSYTTEIAPLEGLGGIQYATKGLKCDWPLDLLGEWPAPVPAMPRPASSAPEPRVVVEGKLRVVRPQGFAGRPRRQSVAAEFLLSWVNTHAPGRLLELAWECIDRKIFCVKTWRAIQRRAGITAIRPDKRAPRGRFTPGRWTLSSSPA